jgi:hypothetical protein
LGFAYPDLASGDGSFGIVNSTPNNYRRMEAIFVLEQHGASPKAEAAGVVTDKVAEEVEFPAVSNAFTT